MTNIITRGLNPKSLKEGVRSWIGVNYDNHDKKYAKIFDQVSSKHAYEEDVVMSGFGQAVRKDEGEAITFQVEKQAYVIRTDNATYGLGFRVSQEEIEDGKYPKVFKDRAMRLGDAFVQTKEVVGHSILNNAFSSTWADGTTLISTTHGSNVGSQSNKLPTDADLSEAALEAIIIMISKAKDANGNLKSFEANKLIVPSDLAFDAQRITMSELSTALVVNGSNGITNTNALNILRAKKYIKEVVVTPFLTDADAWFVSTNVMKGKGLIYQLRRPLMVKTDFDNNTWTESHSASERYAFNCLDWRAIYGTPGA